MRDRMRRRGRLRGTGSNNLRDTINLKVTSEDERKHTIQSFTNEWGNTEKDQRSVPAPTSA